MAEFNYIDKTGTMKTLTANDSNTALGLLRSNSNLNADPTSGVMEIKTQTVAPTPVKTIPAPAVVSSETARNLTNSNINTVNQATIPNINVNQTATKSPYTDKIASYTSEMDALRPMISAQNQSLIDSIGRQFDELYKKQDLANKNYEGVVTQAGISSGRNRYAPTIYGGEQKTAVELGINKLADILAKKNDAVIKAQNAKSEGDYKMLNDQISNYNTLITAERNATNDLLDRAIKLNQDARAQIKSTSDELDATIKRLSPSILSIVEQNPEQYDEIIQRTAQDYGIDAQSLAGAVEAQRLATRKQLPTSVDEYEYYKGQGGTGTYLEFLTKQKAASTIARGGSSNSSGTNILTQKEAQSLNLPSNLVGLKDSDVIFDLSLSKVPEWFSTFLANTEGDKQFSEAGIKSVWDTFRNSPDMNVYRTTFNLTKDTLDQDADWAPPTFN